MYNNTLKLTVYYVPQTSRIKMIFVPTIIKQLIGVIN